MLAAGQFIASSPTLFPEEYVLEFEKCLDRTEAVPWHVIKRTVQAELGRPIEEVFLSVDPIPLASASVAQVHCAGASSPSSFGRLADLCGHITTKTAQAELGRSTEEVCRVLFSWKGPL